MKPPVPLAPALVFVLTLVVNLSACTPALNWRVVRPAQADGLAALFPCKPDPEVRTLHWPGLAGPPVATHLLSCKADGATWALSHATVADPRQVEALLAAMRQAVQNNLQAAASLQEGARGKPGIVQASDLGPAGVAATQDQPLARHWRWSITANAANAAQERWEVQSWHFSHGATVFQASVWWRPAPVDDKKAAQAMETFKSGLNFPR